MFRILASPRSLDPPPIAANLSPQKLSDLSSISTDPRAQDFSNHLRRFEHHTAVRYQGRHRWHAVATGDKISLIPADIFQEETRRCLRHIVHRAARAPSPLSPTRRYCRHENRFGKPNADESSCSTNVVSNLCDSDAKSEDLQLLHIFKEVKTRTMSFHPYRPQLLAAEAGNDFAVSVWGIHRSERVTKLTLEDAVPFTPEPVKIVDVLAIEFKRHRAVAEAYE